MYTEGVTYGSNNLDYRTRRGDIASTDNEKEARRIYTDIGRDGMMSGVNIDATVKLAEAVGIPVIASGGLTDLDDIRALCAAEKNGITGAITGRAIYEGSIDFAQAQQLADSLGE